MVKSKRRSDDEKFEYNYAAWCHMILKHMGSNAIPINECTNSQFHNKSDKIIKLDIEGGEA